MVESLQHFTLENAVAGLSLVQHFEWNMPMTRNSTILGILVESMQHFTLENAVAGLNLVWHFLFKDVNEK